MMTLSPLRCLSLLTPLLFAGCMQSVSIKPVATDLPALANVNIQSSTVQFYAMANGCSTNESFEAQVVDASETPSWQVVRLRPDLCRRSSMQTKFDIPLPKATLSLEKLLNKTSSIPARQ